MKELQRITEEINKLTLKMEQEYPEIYLYLDENPITIPCCIHPILNTTILAGYLHDLKQLLEHHIETHKKEIE